jgi:hypothetical protein
MATMDPIPGVTWTIPTTATSGAVTSAKVHASAVSGVYSPGGYIIPTTTTGGVTTTSARKPLPIVAPPALRLGGRRVLIAFLDENDDIEWSAQVTCLRGSVDYDDSSGVPEMTLDVRLEDRTPPTK